MQDLLKIAGSQSTWNKLPEYKGQDVKTHGQVREIFKRVSTNGIVGGPHLVGILDEKYKVYKNPYYPDNEILVGAKGKQVSIA